jgi:hypothetical protein
LTKATLTLYQGRFCLRFIWNLILQFHFALLFQDVRDLQIKIINDPGGYENDEGGVKNTY